MSIRDCQNAIYESDFDEKNSGTGNVNVEIRRVKDQCYDYDPIGNDFVRWSRMIDVVTW